MANEWFNYITRSYQQIKEAVLERIVARVPELTDHTESNVFVKMISIWAGLMEMVGYYVDNAARETKLVALRRWQSMVNKATEHDYRIKSPVAASVDLRFTISATHGSDITIPSGTVVTNGEEVKFTTTADGIIPAGETVVTIPATQYTASFEDVALGTGDGTENQAFQIEEAAVADGTVMVKVGSEFWEAKETLGYSLPEDQVFVVTVDNEKLPLVQFGDGFNGAMPSGAITANYKTTEGAAGNLAPNALTTIETSLTLPGGITATVTNLQRSSGGADLETLERLRYRIPRSIRTLKRAVTRLDFKDIAELVGGVASALVDFNCGKLITVYVAPDGGGLASSTLLANVLAALSEQDTRIIGRQLETRTAGEVVIKLTVNVKAKPQFQNTYVKETVEAAILAFLAPENQTVKGTVELGDIYQTVENSDGVASSNVVVMTTVPFGRMLGATENPLDWTRAVLPGSTVSTVWKVVVVNGTSYQLFKGGSFIGTFDFGDDVAQAEISFNITEDGYSVGDSWEFWTYPYFGTVELKEPSLPISRVEDLTINVTGGL